MLTQLVVDSAVVEAYPAALGAPQLALTVDPLAEERHRWLMALYAAQGDRSSAPRQFEHCGAARRTAHDLAAGLQRD